MSDGGITASVVFHFDAHDRVDRLTADRYYNDSAARERWVIPVTAWSELAGVVMPSQGEVTWELAAGTFSYFRWEITGVEIDPRAGRDAP